MKADSPVRRVTYQGVTTEVLKPSREPIATAKKPVTLAKGVEQTGEKTG